MSDSPPTATTAPTKVEVPEGTGTAGASPTARGGRPSAADMSTGRATRPMTPDEAIHAQEIEHMRMFVYFVIALAALCVGAVIGLGGDQTARIVMCIGSAAAILGAMWVSHGISTNFDVAPQKLVVYQFGFGLACVGAIGCGFYYWGVFSPALLVVPFSVFVFTLGQKLSLALINAGALIAVHMAMALMTILGVLPDVGVFSPSDRDPAHLVIALLLTQFIFIATIGIARRVRRVARVALEDLGRAGRDVAQRELLLAEARQDLRQALQIGGPGRYTEQQIGQYRLGVVLGRGGMGEVYEATHLETGRPAALKLLYPHLLSDPGHYERFMREARMAASLQARNVVRVLAMSEAGESPPYLVMEKLSGRDLGAVLKARPRMPPAEVAEMVRQTALGLAAAHAAGIVHRDLKPANLFRVEAAGAEPLWKILDFGASKLVQHGTLTEGMIVGTPQYMSPEQARGAPADHRSDVYALAVIAYRALTGYPAFSGTDTPAVMFAVAHRMPERPSEISPLPPQVDDVLAVGMAKDPEHRFESARELAEHLAEAVHGRVAPDVRTRAWLLASDWPWGVAVEGSARAHGAVADKATVAGSPSRRSTESDDAA
jgi:eukaryotic-like serine/threonine-protein kinase